MYMPGLTMEPPQKKLWKEGGGGGGLAVSATIGNTNLQNVRFVYG